MRINFLNFKKVLWLVGLLIATTTAWAGTANFTYEDLQGQGSSGSGSAFTGATDGDITMGGVGNGNSSYVQIYAGGTLTFTPLNGVVITEITLTATTGTYARSWSASDGAVSVSGTTITWEGESEGTVTLTNTANSQARITAMDVDYTSGSGGCSSGKVTRLSQLSAGDEIILYYETSKYELSGISSGRGDYTSYTGSPAGAYILTVEAGSVSGTYSFKHGTDGYLCNNDGGNNLNLTATKAQNSSWTVSFSSNNAVITNYRYDTKTIMWNSSSPRFACYASGVNNTHAIQMYKICACSTNPTMANATTGVGFSLSSIPVTVSDLVVGAGCEWTDAGFVWSATSTTPSLQSNGNASTNCTKVQIKTSGSDASYSGNLTGSFATNTPYYFRAYGKNSYASATYQYSPTVSTVYLQSISYNANGGSGSMADQIIKRNQATTSRSNTFTRTGYTFNGWNTNPDGTSGTNYANQALITTTTNLTLYAKWTVQSYTLTWNLNGGTVTVAGTGAAVNATGSPSSSVNYGAPITAPTVVKEGNTFTGWNTTPAGTMPASNTTYTAQWTPNEYDVTWKVNNTDYSAGGSSSVTYGNHITTLPTAPNPPTYGCGDVFVGWTTVQNFVYGESPLYTTASEFPNATDDQVFYAVYADYEN